MTTKINRENNPKISFARKIQNFKIKIKNKHINVT